MLGTHSTTDNECFQGHQQSILRRHLSDRKVPIIERAFEETTQSITITLLELTPTVLKRATETYETHQASIKNALQI